MLDAKATEDGQKANLEITLPDGQVSPEMVPIQVEGTSGDTKYTNLVTVLTGYISYAHGKIMGDNVSTPVPRIRVAKNDKGLAWTDTWLIDKKANWPTVQPTHLANTGGSANDTQAMISNGLEKLIKLTSLYK